MKSSRAISSIPGICEVEMFGGTGTVAAAPPELLVEIPHGATRAHHFIDLRGKLHGQYPLDLDEFFFVNTDVGAPECAREIARRIVGRPAEHRVLVLRCLIPRTFIDCNRVVEGSAEDPATGGLTPPLPEYVTHPKDVEKLHALYDTYQGIARSAYELVCGSGGLALTLHTYAPRSVRITTIDDNIVAALHRAYLPEHFERWEPRPEAEVISETQDGVRLAPPGLVEALRARYAEAGIELAENATYRLHPATMGYIHSAVYPGRVLCVELNRASLADPFTPFEQMRIGPEKVARLSAPLAAALEQALAPQRS